MARLDAANARRWSNALVTVLEMHLQVAKRRYEEGFEAGARACGPMSRRQGELRVTELVLQILEAGETMKAVADRLEDLVKETKT